MKLYEPKPNDLEIELDIDGTITVVIDCIPFAIFFSGRVALTEFTRGDSIWQVKVTHIEDISLMSPDSYYIEEKEVLFKDIHKEHIPLIVSAIERHYNSMEQYDLENALDYEVKADLEKYEPDGDGIETPEEAYWDNHKTWEKSAGRIF